MRGVHNYDDLRRAAKRRLPKIAFDFIEGGVDSEEGLDRNEQAFLDQRLVPKYMVDVSKRSMRTELFGRTYAMPVGIAPTGIAGLFRPGADLMLAAAARKADIPFIMSGSATASLEELAKVAPDHGWYQLYPALDKSISLDMIKRADVAGLSTLVVTVDVPVHSNRERNKRNGWARPLKLTMASKLEALAHPGWMVDYYRTGGPPTFPNWAPYAGPNADADRVGEFIATQTAPPLDWSDIERFRRAWPRKMVLKGVMHPDDAVRAAAIGIDGLMISNHGARQLDRAPSPLEVLPVIRDRVGDKLTLMFDSGIRRGSDVLTALCMGAKFVFVGRWTLYGVAAAGEPGAAHALGLMRNEISLTMGQMGAPDIKSLGPDFLMWNRPEDLDRNRDREWSVEAALPRRPDMAMQSKTDVAAIEAVIATYFDGLYEGNVEKLGRAFHEVSHLYSLGADGTVQDLPRAQWLDGVASRPSGKARNLARADRIVAIDMSGPETAIVKVECQLPPRYFTDYLTLLKLKDGSWRIVSKTFRTTVRD